MFLTSSLRRKLAISFALVVCMLALLSGSGISGLLSYRGVIQDLNFTVHSAPRAGDVEAAIGLLFEPLLQPPTSHPDALRDQQKLFRQRLEQSRAEIEKFRKKQELLPPTPDAIARKPITNAMLDTIDRGLVHLGNQQGLLAIPEAHDQTVQQMIQNVATLETWAQKIPSPQDGLERSLKESVAVYTSRFWLVIGASVGALILLLSLMACVYSWIFRPIRLLHQGAARVAQGDFNFRLHLPGRDEMAELAEAFNKMTQRFQEDKSDLDQQVCERSKQLLRSERLAGVGFLAAGVAHEINNPLSAISMAAESLSGRLGDVAVHFPDAELQTFEQYLGMIQREAFRCQQITSRLLDFARGQDAPRTRFDLSKIVGEVIDMVGHLSRFRGHQILFQHSDPCYLQVNGAEIKQVVLNLVANALESMDAAGTLKIEIHDHPDEVVLEFIDDGCGMPPRVLENLFEPFFTERKSGKGTGLGLSITHRIVTDHGGRIEPYSAGPGKGSTFRVRLPRYAASGVQAA